MTQKDTDNLTSNTINVESLREKNIQTAYDLWKTDFLEHQSKNPLLSTYWITDTSQVKEYLKKHTQSGKGAVAFNEEKIVGYMVYDNFHFHGEEAAYCSIVGHASVKYNRLLIYQQLYRHLSDKWIKDNILNHYYTFYRLDTQLLTEFYHRGFGLYAVDAYRTNDPLYSSSRASIEKASPSDVSDLMRLDDEFRAYTREAPLFFIRENKDSEAFNGFIDKRDSAAFISRINGEAVGFMSIRLGPENDLITLTDCSMGNIVGAFVEREYRDKGVGVGLLRAIIEWSREIGIERIHLDYESANLLASRFWPKYFTPLLYSVKRNVNPDILNQ